MSLPEIPVDLWRQFQNTIFGEKADQTEAAESFRWGVDDALTQLPPDDGTNWEAEARRLEEEQQRRQEEQRRQIEEQARRDQEDYERIAEERAIAARANQLASTYNDPTAGGTIDQPLPRHNPTQPDISRQNPTPASFGDMANNLITQAFGPSPQPIPEDASQSERFVQDMSRPSEPLPPPMRNEVPFDPATNTTGPRPTDAAETMSDRPPPSFADQANSLITDAFGPESPIGSAVSGAYQTAVRGGMPDVVDIVRKGDASARETIDTYGAGAFSRDTQREQDLQAEQNRFLESRGKTLTGAQRMGQGEIDPDFAAENPDRAEELRRVRDENLMTVGGMAGTGSGKLAEDAISAVKSLRAAGVADDVILAAERNLAEGADMALSAVQKLTRGATQALPESPSIPKPPLEAPTSPQPGDRIRLPDGTRARVDETDLAPSVFEPPRSTAAEPAAGPQVGERVRLPDGTRATVTEGGGTPPTGRPPAPPSGGPPSPPEGGRQLPLSGFPEPTPEDLTHVRGFGIFQGVDPVGRAVLEDVAARGRQFPEGVRRTDMPEIAAQLGLSPEEVAAKWLRKDTREGAAEIEVLRQGIGTVLDDIQRAASRVQAGAELSATEKMDLASNMTKAGVAAAFLKGGRRAGESAGRTLGQLQKAIQVPLARGVYDSIDAASEAARRAGLVLKKIHEGGRVPEGALRDLERAADQLDGASTRDVLGEGGEAVRRKVRRDAGLPEPPTSPGGAQAPGAPKEPSFAERWGQLKRAHTAAEEAGDTARMQDISDQISALSAEVRADAIDRARKAVEETKKPLTMEEAQRIVDERLGQGAVSRIRREEMDAAKGFTAGKLQADLDKDVQRKVLAALKKHEAEQDKFLADLERRSHESEWAYTQAENAGIQKEALQGMAQRLKEIAALARQNPQDPRLLEGIPAMMADMTAVSQRGFEMSQDIKQSLTKAGLVRFAGKLSPEQVDQFVTMLGTIDPSNPRTLGNVMRAMRSTSFIDRLREYALINMFASTATSSPLGVNNIANAAVTVANRGFKAPVMAGFEQARTLGGRRGIPEVTWGDVGAGWKELKNVFLPSLRDATQTMRYGSTERQVEHAAQMGDFSMHRPEGIAEAPQSVKDVFALKWGRFGELGHMLTTRQLEASDAFWGNMLYGSELMQAASAKARKTPGLTVEKILANPLDHEDVVERAGKVGRYSLLKNRDEMTRMLSRITNAAPDASAGRKLSAFAAHQVLPITTVPWNSVKQLVEYGPAGALGNVARAAVQKDPYRRAELAAHAAAGATLTGMGIMGAMSRIPGREDDDPSWTWVTGNGPLDRDKKQALIAQGWQANSIWNPATGQYNSIMGTPMAAMAQPVWLFEGWREAVDKGERKGTADDWSDWLTTGLSGSAVAAGGAILDQSAMRSLGDLSHAFDPRSGGASQFTAGIASRYIPGGALTAQLARLGDDFQRDAKTFGERMIERTPARGLLPIRQGPLGEPLRNDPTGPLGAIFPFPRRTTERPNPTYQVFREAGLDVGAPKTTLSLKGNEISLTPDEQRAWQRERGQVLDEIGHDLAADPSWQDAPVEKRQQILQRLVARAGAAADKVVLDMIPDGEIDRRIERSRGARYREGA